jgi:hypothetical protein
VLCCVLVLLIVIDVIVVYIGECPALLLHPTGRGYKKSF